MEEQTTAAARNVRNPLSYSGAEIAARGSTLEWLETDGLGGFACGTAAGVRTRKYHGWYIPAIPPPRRRWMLVAGCEEFVAAEGRTTGISTQLYRDTVYPDGRANLKRFALEPFPTWQHETESLAVERSLCLPRGRSAAISRRFTCVRPARAPGSSPTGTAISTIRSKRGAGTTRTKICGVPSSGVGSSPRERKRIWSSRWRRCRGTPRSFVKQSGGGGTSSPRPATRCSTSSPAAPNRFSSSLRSTLQPFSPAFHGSATGDATR